MGFDNVHCTISYSSNPGIHSILTGVPAFVSTHSLAYPVGNDIDFLHDIENPMMPERQQWLNDYAHTEYTVEEISQGIPLKHLTIITIIQYNVSMEQVNYTVEDSLELLVGLQENCIV